MRRLPGDFSVPFGKGIAGTAAKARRPIYSADVTTDPRYIPHIASTRSELAIPLMVRDEVVGVLDCQSDLSAFFDNETVDLLTLFATQASIGLQNAKLYSMLQRRAAQLEAINAIAKRTTVEVDLKELLDRLCTQLPAVVSRSSMLPSSCATKTATSSCAPSREPLYHVSRGDAMPQGYACTTEVRAYIRTAAIPRSARPAASPRPRGGLPAAGLLWRKSRTSGLCHRAGQSVPAPMTFRRWSRWPTFWPPPPRTPATSIGCASWPIATD